MTGGTRSNRVDPWDLENVAYLRRQSSIIYVPCSNRGENVLKEKKLSVQHSNNQKKSTNINKRNSKMVTRASSVSTGPYSLDSNASSSTSGSRKILEDCAAVEEVAFCNPRYEPLDYGSYVDMSSFRPRSIFTSLTDGDSYEDCEMSGSSGGCEPDYQRLSSLNSSQTAPSWQFSPGSPTNMCWQQQHQPVYAHGYLSPAARGNKKAERATSSYMEYAPLEPIYRVREVSAATRPARKNSSQQMIRPRARSLMDPNASAYVDDNSNYLIRPVTNIGMGKHGHLQIDYSLSWQRLDYYVTNIAV